VRRCLSKDPETRWQNANDLAAELRWLREVNGGPGPVAGAAGRLGRGWRVAGLVVALGLSIALASAGVTWLMHPPTARGVLSRPSLDVGPAEELNAGGVNAFWLPTPGGSRTAFAWTPDGQALVFVGRRSGLQQLYVRRLDTAEARPLANTEGAQVPAVSPDGKWVAFWAKQRIVKVPIEGGPSMDVATGHRWPPRGLAWDASGRLYFGTEPEGVIWQIPADEGAPSVVSTSGESDAKHSMPVPLPGGRALLYTVRTRQYSWGDEEVGAFTLATGQRKILLKDASDARYVPTGHLLFLRRGVLFAVPFDAERLEVHGAPVAVLETVAQALNGGHAGDCTGAGQFAVAPTGTVAWLPGPLSPGLQSQLVTVDRSGRVSTLSAPLRDYSGEVRLSPDRRRLAVTIRTRTEVGPWLYDLGRRTLTPVASDGEAYAPTWSPDGQQLAFSWLADRRRSLVSQSADSSAPPRVLASGRLFPSSFAPDGRHLAALTRSFGDIAIATLEDGQARVQPFLEVPHGELWPSFSPDGRWLAYGSRVSGRDEVYVRPYPGPGREEQVSTDGGYSPAWHPGGKELLFIRRIPGPPAESSMMAVEFRAGPPVTFGQPRRLFTFDPRVLHFSCAPVRCFDLAPDGQQFYVVQTPKPPPPPVVTHIRLIVNWFEELKTKVPVPK
jgi:serine/threonine-protein kinase